MMQRNTAKRLLTVVLAVGVMMSMAMSQNLAAQEEEASDNGGDAFVVGVYDAEAVFEKHPAQKRMMEVMRELQPAMQQAQQQGNNEQIQQLQQQYEQERSKMIEQFESDLKEALPSAAKAAEVKVVAQNVDYTAEGVDTRNITSEVIEALPEKAEKESPPQMPPQAPQGEEPAPEGGQEGGEAPIQIPGQ